MRLSCSQWSFPLIDGELALDLIARLGFEQIDVMISPEGSGAHHEYDVVNADLPGTARRLREQLEARGLELADVFWAPAEEYVAQHHDPELLLPLVAHTRVLHLRAARPGRLQSLLAENTIAFEPLLDALAANGRDTTVTVEYCWSDWKRLNEVDVLSETVLLRDRLRARPEGAPTA